MSGIVGSYFNTRGSGVVAKLGTDGQVFTSTGAGLSQGFEAAAGGGKLLQVQSYSTDERHSSSTASFVDLSSFLVTLTPAATDSRIWINVSIGHYSSVGENAIFVVERAISGGSTELCPPLGEAEGSRLGGHGKAYATSVDGSTTNFSILDITHNTTSEITYQVQWAVDQASYINRQYTDTDDACNGARTVSGITAWEIGA